jgi:hypothetical protein
MNREDVVKKLEESLAAVTAQFDAPPADLKKSYAPGKWTVRQVLAHLADCELIGYWRFGRAVAEPDSTVEPFEQDEWAARMAYSERPLALDRDVFLSTRRLLIHLVKTLPEDRLKTESHHLEKGALDGYRWAALQAGHCEHHLGQMNAARTGKPWVKPKTSQGGLYGAAGPEYSIP